MEQRITAIIGDLEETVDFLLKAKRAGLHLVIEFNGVDLHSDTITADSAYKAVTGMTKDEYEKACEEEAAQYKREMAEEERKAKERIPEWIEKGNKLIYPERQELWEECVNIRAEDLYHGTDLDDALKLMEMLDNGDNLGAVEKEFRKQGHTGTSARIVISIVTKFSKIGPKFARLVHEGPMSEQEELNLLKIEAENAEYENNSFKKWLESYKKEREEEKKRAQNKIPEWIEKGKKMIYPEKYEEWEKCVRTRADDLYCGLDLEYALELMELIYFGEDSEELKDTFKTQGNSGASAQMVLSIVTEFSKKGPQFAREMAKLGVIDAMDEEYLTKIEERNKEYENNARQKYAEEEREREAETMRKIPEWIEKGNKLIYPERQEKWKECVDARAGDIYHGLDLDDSLVLMEMLDQGCSFTEVKTALKDQNHSGFSESMVLNILLSFSKRGPEFIRAIRGDSLSDEELEAIEKIEKENAKYEANKDGGKAY